MAIDSLDAMFTDVDVTSSVCTSK